VILWFFIDSEIPLEFDVAFDPGPCGAGFQKKSILVIPAMNRIAEGTVNFNFTCVGTEFQFVCKNIICGHNILRYRAFNVYHWHSNYSLMGNKLDEYVTKKPL